MTLLFHCDESYDQHHHVHLGVLSDGAQAAAAERSVRELLRSVLWEHGPRVDELHGHEIIGGHGPWAALNLDTRIDVCRRSLEIIRDCGLEILYRGISVDGYRKKYTASTDPRRDAFKFMFGDLLSKHLSERCKARKDYALVITDHQNQYADELRYAHLVNSVSGGSSISEPGIVDTCHFVDSKHSPLVQLADVAAYIQRRRLTTPTEHDDRAEKAMASLSSLVLCAVPEPKWAHCSVHTHFA